MDITKLNDSELADLTANLVDLLGGPELSAIDPNVRAELVTAFGTKPADFVAELSAAVVADDEKKSAFSTKDLTRAELIFLARRTNFALKAGAAPKSQFDLARFGFPSPGVSKYIAQIPTDMAAVGFSNGTNTGSFRGNNNRNSIMYEIWRREGVDGVWLKHLLTRKQTFTDRGVTPGRYYEYRVRAVAAQTESVFSNSTVVYGVL